MKNILVGMLFAVSALCFGQVNTGNLPAQIIASGARTAATVNSGDQTNSQWHRAHIIINVSAYTSGNYTPHIQGKDPVSGTYYDILVGTAIASTGITILKVGPGFGSIPNGATADMLPQAWRVQLIGVSTPSMTFSVGAFLE